jgi:hypothetical protein
MLTKPLLCNVVFIGMLYIPESLNYLEFISLRWKEPYYDKFNVTSMKKAISEVSERFCADSNLEKSDPKISSGPPYLKFGRSPVNNIRPDDVVIPSEHLSMSRSFEQLRLDTTRRHGNMSRHFLEFQKNPAFECICPDDVTIPSDRQSVFNK